MSQTVLYLATDLDRERAYERARDERERDENATDDFHDDEPADWPDRLTLLWDLDRYLYNGPDDLSSRLSPAALDELWGEGDDTTEPDLDAEPLWPPEHLYGPDRWRPRDPARLAAAFRDVLDWVHAHNETLPVLYYMRDAARDYGSLSADLTLPEYADSGHPVPTVRLDGDHRDPEHRGEIRVFDVVHRWRRRRLLGVEVGPPEYEGADETPRGWVEAQPEIEVGGFTVLVQPHDTLTRIAPDLATALARCEQAVRDGEPRLYWLWERV